MKRILPLLLAACSAFGAGTVTQTMARVGETNTFTLTIAFTADSADGSVPATALRTSGAGQTPDGAPASTNGYMITQVITDPGSTAPTANYDITFVNAQGLDIMGGNLMNRHTSNTEVALPGPLNAVINGTVTFTLTNNSVNSATGAVIIYLAPNGQPARQGPVSLDQTTPGTTNAVSIAQVGATTVVNGGVAGTLGIGGTAASNGVITQNPVLVGAETVAVGSQPTAATAGRQRQLVSALDGAPYVRYGGPVMWSCGLNGIGTTLTECQAAPAAGLRLYITDVVTQSSTATAGLFTLRFGTGTNCGTGTGNLFFGSASALMASPANTAPVNHFHLTTPIVLTAANAVCVLGVVTNTTNIQITGFTAP